MGSSRASYGNFRLPLIIETINYEQGDLVTFSPEKHKNSVEGFAHEYEEKNSFEFHVSGDL